jgi:hypothetical protein
MAHLDLITDFEWSMNRLIADAHKPGAHIISMGTKGRGADGDSSLSFAEARYLHKHFGAVRESLLEAGHWEIDNRSGRKPILRLSPNLFAHVADACEAA